MGYVSVSKRCLVIKECIEVWIANFPPNNNSPPPPAISIWQWFNLFMHYHVYNVWKVIFIWMWGPSHNSTHTYQCTRCTCCRMGSFVLDDTWPLDSEKTGQLSLRRLSWLLIFQLIFSSFHQTEIKSRKTL